ncbi:hypothetical protein E4T48_01047 [Aureobasidium sp. EXF-10727]|nr:hypothetical protein E4T48_01047 [Aureobasidium sp. EXF-10727]
MATPIDWNNYPSDGDASQSTGKTTTRLDKYLKYLLSVVNQDPGIATNFGPAGVTFTALPLNYKLETRDRSEKKPGQRGFDNYVHGHPDGIFDTTKDFARHVVSLLLNRLQHCACTICGGVPQQAAPAQQVIPAQQPIGIPQLALSAAPTHNNNMATSSNNNHNVAIPFNNNNNMAPSSVTNNMASSSPMAGITYTQPPVNTDADEDGTPNVFEDLLHHAKQNQGQPMSVAITEPLSMDWLAEQDLAQLPAYLEALQTSARWAPRLGEIVLIARNLKDTQLVKFDEQAQVYKIHEPKLGWVGLPVWEAAVVTQLDKNHLTASPLDQKQPIADVHGLRVEPMPEVGNSDKPWSTRFTTVPLINVRPFHFWQELLNGADVDDPRECHPTVRHALAAMSSMSVVGRYHFSSNGKEARVYCKGMYVGAEFIVPGDVVRFSSPIHNNSFGKDVVHIKHIYVSYNLEREPTPPGSVHVTGVAYTTDNQHAYGQYQHPLPFDSLPFPDMRGYGLWYKMGEGDTLVRMPYNKLFTRVIEQNWMKAVMGKAATMKVAAGLGAPGIDKDHTLDITYGVEGVGAAREYSAKHDARIDRTAGQLWYLGEDRVDQLDLHLVNDQDVGHKARYGFESTPTPLQEAHLKAMFRARNARQKGPGFKIAHPNSGPSNDQLYQVSDLLARANAATAADTEEEAYRSDLSQRLIYKFENEFTQRTTEDDMDEFLS